MTESTVIPVQDLAPSLTSRVVVIRGIDITEGYPAQGEITFSLPWDVSVKPDGRFVQAGSVTVKLDANGEARVRLPTADPDTDPDSWFIVVKKSWAPHAYPIRIPVGETQINLVDIPVVQELPTAAAPGFFLTGAAATIATGGQASVSTTVAGGIANFAFTIPSGEWERGVIAAGADLDSLLIPGAYNVGTYAIANSLLNRPTLAAAINRSTVEVLKTATGNVVQRWTTLPGAAADPPVMQRQYDDAGAWSAWRRTDDISSASRQYFVDQIAAARWLRSALTAGTDLNTVVADGAYRIGTYAIANSLLNRPTITSAVNPATLEVLALANGALKQRWTTLAGASADSPTLERRRDNGGAWTDWVRTDLVVSSPLEAAAMAVENDRKNQNRILALTLPPGPLPVWAWSGPASPEPLTLASHDGSGSATHPSVIHVPGGWGGYAYWMAMTPYPNGNERHEDPNILASQDGVTWVVPPGLTNPLDDQPGSPGPYNSDTHLAWGPNGQLVCSWRMVDRPNGGQEVIKWRTSTDGVTWTPAVEVYRIPLGTSNSSMVSQTLVWLGDRWRMYAVSTIPNPNRLIYVESTKATPTSSDWGPAVACDTGGVPGGRDWWHCEVRQHEGAWIGVMNDVSRGAAGVDGDIYLMRSTDGVTWQVSTLPLVPKIGKTHDTIYKSGFLASGAGDDLSLQVYYAAFDRVTRDHRVYLTHATSIKS